MGLASETGRITSLGLWEKPVCHRFPPSPLPVRSTSELHCPLGRMRRAYQTWLAVAQCAASEAAKDVSATA